MSYASLTAWARVLGLVWLIPHVLYHEQRMPQRRRFDPRFGRHVLLAGLAVTLLVNRVSGDDWFDTY